MTRDVRDLAGELARYVQHESAHETLAGRVLDCRGLAPPQAAFEVATVEGALFEVRVTELRPAPGGREPEGA